MTWATRSIGHCARYLRTTRGVRPSGQPASLSRHLHISSATRQDVASPDTAGNEAEVLEQTPTPIPGPSSTPSSAHSAFRKPIKHPLSTFDPTKLTSSDYVDLSGRVACDMTLSDKSISVSYMGPREYDDQHYFPHGTHGFFYLARSPNMHFLTSELRFRITDTSTPGAFELGRDLVLPYGLPWSIPLAKMVSWPSWFPVIWKLMEDGLVPSAVKKIHPEFLKPLEESGEVVGRVLHSYHQPFIYNFDKKWPGSVLLLGRHRPRLVSLPDIFDGKNIMELNSLKGVKDVLVPVYGSAILCFEKSRNRAAIRVLRIVNRLRFPPGSDGEKVAETARPKRPKLKLYPGELARVLGTAITVPIKSTDFMDPPTSEETVEEPSGVAEPDPVAEPAPAAELAPAVESAPDAESAPAVEPAPAAEPASTEDASPEQPKPSAAS